MRSCKRLTGRVLKMWTFHIYQNDYDWFINGPAYLTSISASVKFRIKIAMLVPQLSSGFRGQSLDQVDCSKTEIHPCKIYVSLFVAGNTRSCQSWMLKFLRPWSFTTSSWTRLPSTLPTPRCSNSTHQPAQLYPCRWENSTWFVFCAAQFLSSTTISSCVLHWYLNILFM